MQGSFAGNGYGTLTQAAGTPIQFLVPPYVGAVTRVTRVVYTAGNTTHTLTFLRPIGRTTATAAAAASATTVTLAADPGPSGNGLAANDFMAIRETDGVTRLYKVSAWNGTSLVVTLTAGLTAGVAIGGKVWDFGITTDTDTVTGFAHPAVAGTTAATTTYQDSDSGVVAGLAQDDPILLNSNNATGPGTLNQLNWGYTKF